MSSLGVAFSDWSAFLSSSLSVTVLIKKKKKKTCWTSWPGLKDHQWPASVMCSGICGGHNGGTVAVFLLTCGTITFVSMSQQLFLQPCSFVNSLHWHCKKKKDFTLKVRFEKENTFCKYRFCKSHVLRSCVFPCAVKGTNHKTQDHLHTFAFIHFLLRNWTNTLIFISFPHLCGA